MTTQPVNLAGGLGGTAPAPVPTPAPAPAPPAGAAAGEAGASTPAEVINALPPTAAGTPAGTPLTAPTDQGFQVALVSPSPSPNQGQTGDLGSISGARLFVLEGVPDVQADKQFQLPPEAFAHTDPNATIKLEARQSNGEPLPGWLSFNPGNGTFSGAPPDGKPTPVEVQVLARDNQAREASVIFKLELGAAAPAGTGSAAVPDSNALGFPVARVGADSTASLPGSAGDTKPVAGDRLFVLDGVQNAVGDQRFQLPQDAFAHTDAKAVVRLEARQANGEPLPAWMQFDPVSGLFRGTPPDGKPVSLEVVVIARDNEAREASVVFTLELGVPGADAPVASPARDGASTGLSKPGPGVSPDKAGSSGTAPAQPGAGLGEEQRAEAQKLALGDLAAVQADALGSAAPGDRGFPVARVPADDLQRVSGTDGAALAEQRLFVFQGVLSAIGDTQYRIPADAFGHTDPAAIVRLDARSADGSPLPPWLQFDALTGTFRGMPPGGARTLLEIVLTARDEEGREANIAFTLELGVKAGEGEPVKADGDRAPAEPRARADLDDGDLEKVAGDAADADAGDAPAKAKVEKAKPARAGAVPFAEQVLAAKTARDPLLAKILGAKDKQAGRSRL
ncbi:MAG: putative Ig domain-containing protein [Proteobacteria bacterium]|nr:putative Ig domain-containing protein [Pseudomonadota bacterium]